MERRVVITGLGAVTPVGLTAPESWAALKAGTRGIDTITRFDTEGYKVTVAAEVKDFDPLERRPHQAGGQAQRPRHPVRLGGFRRGPGRRRADHRGLRGVQG